MDSKTSGYTLSEQQQTFPASVFRIDDVRSQNEKHSHKHPPELHQSPINTSALTFVFRLFCVRALIPTHVSFWLCSFARKLQNVEPRLPLRRVFTSWRIFSGLMFTVWQFQVECVSAFEPASCSTLRWSRPVTSPLILKSGARIQIITEKLINVCLKVNNGQYLRIEGDEHGEGPHWCQNRFISTTHQI